MLRVYFTVLSQATLAISILSCYSTKRPVQPETAPRPESTSVYDIDSPRSANVLTKLEMTSKCPYGQFCVRSATAKETDLHNVFETARSIAETILIENGQIISYSNSSSNAAVVYSSPSHDARDTKRLETGQITDLDRLALEYLEAQIADGVVSPDNSTQSTANQDTSYYEMVALRGSCHSRIAETTYLGIFRTLEAREEVKVRTCKISIRALKVEISSNKKRREHQDPIAAKIEADVVRALNTSFSE